MTFRKSNLYNFITSIFISIVIILTFLIFEPSLVHWFIIPIFILCTLIATDIIKWIKNDLEVFDGRAILAFLSLHFFVLAPLLHVTTDYWLANIYPPIMPSDWRPWLGFVSIINLLGYSLYLIFRSVFLKKVFLKKIRLKSWQIDKKKFLLLTSIFLPLSLIVQVYIYSLYGGIGGYIRAYSERESFQSNFDNMGWLFMFSESFPVVFIMLMAVILPQKYRKSTFIIICLLFTFLLERMYFGGLRGSRSNTVWAVFWALGIVHYFIKPISRKFLAVFGSVILCFMLIYGVYKSEGIDFWETIETQGVQNAITENDRGLNRVLLVDMARSDIQAYILFKIINYDDYSYQYGQTYLSALKLLVPDKLRIFDTSTKVAAGTNLQYGDGVYETGQLASSRIYGLVGEFILNFGYIFSPLSFVALAGVVSFVVSIQQNLNKFDSRRLILPFIILISFLFLVNDLDNMVFLIIKNLTIPFFLILVTSNRVEEEKGV